MSVIWNRMKLQKKHELVKSHSQTQLLANKLRQEGVMGIIEEIMQGVEQVATLLAQPTFDPKLSYKDSIFNLCQHLKIYGSYLEMLFEDQLNRAFIVFRNSSQDERIDQNSRLHLLELIELRAKRWKGSDQMNHYYKNKIETCESTSNLPESLLSGGGTSTMSVSPPLLNPGEVLKTSGKFAKPTRISGKNYCKDEVVIRNADSGKVMGIKGRRVHMIEELSETIISFQRVNPGAKERLVQITGANEESINHSKQLIEDTIRRNASPVRDPSMTFGGGGGGGGGCGSVVTGSTSSINSSASDEGFLPTPQRSVGAAVPSDHHRQSRLLHSLSTNDAHIGEYKFTVVHPKGSTLKIVGDNLDLVRISKLVLDEYFSGEPLAEMEPFYDFENLPKSMESLSFIPTTISPSSLLTNGKEETVTTIAKDEKPNQYTPLRQPRKSVDEIMNGNTSAVISSAANIRKSIEKMICYSIEYLARIAMSPLCLTPPTDWNRINLDYPMIVRKVAESFDANQYLSTRSGDLHTLPNVDDIDMSDI